MTENSSTDVAKYCRKPIAIHLRQAYTECIPVEETTAMTIHTHTNEAWTKLSCDACIDESEATGAKVAAINDEKRAFAASQSSNHNHGAYEVSPSCPACHAIAGHNGFVTGFEPNDTPAHPAEIVAN